MSGQPTVTWDRLSLQGFGRFSGPISVALSAGANVLVAPNEHGKSTLLAGLAAVLFGLDGGEDPSKFTEGRFRNWDAGGPFRGELTFSVGDAHYSIWRDFADRQATLVAHDGQGFRRLAGGKHHATARRGAAAFDEALAGLLGIRSRDLFASTFYLRQPLPDADRLDQAVQGLLSGTGTGFGEALSYLETELRAITMYTADLGVTTADARADRRLEKVRAEIARIGAEAQSQAERIDSLQRLELELGQARQEEAVLLKQLAAAQRLEAAWQTWLRYRTDRDATVRTLTALQGALARAESAEADLSAALRELAAYPEVALLPPAAGEDLARLRQVTKEHADLTARRVERLADRASLHTAISSTVDAIERRPPIASRPNLLGEYDRLVELHRQRDQLRQLRVRLVARRVEIAAQLESAGPRWETLGQTASHALSRQAIHAAWLLDRWQSVEDDVRDLRAARIAATAEWPGFAGLADDQLVAAATAAEQRAEFVSIRDGAREGKLPPGPVADAVKQKARLAALSGATAGAVAGYVVPVDWRMTLGLPGGAMVMALLGAALGATLAWLVARSFGRSAAARQAQASLELLAERLGPQLAGCADPGGEIERWRQAEGKIDLRTARVFEAYGELGLVRPSTVDDIDSLHAQPVPATSPWCDLVQVALVAGERPSSVGELLNWLAGRGDGWWSDAAGTASVRERWFAELAEVQEQLVGIDGGGPSGQESGQLAAVDAELARLQRALGGLDPSTPRAAVVAMQQSHAADRDRLVGLRAELAAIDAELDRLDQDGLRLTGEADALRGDLAPLLARVSVGDLAAASQRFGAGQGVAAQVMAAKQHLAGILRGQGVDAVDALRATVLQRQSELGATAAAWDRLIEDNPALPGPAKADDLATVHAQGATLREQTRRCQEELNAVADRLRDLERQAARLEGAGGALNLAQAANRLDELRREEHDLALDAAAIAKAHAELRAAVREYQDAHRNDLAARTAAQFDHLSAGRGRRVLLDEGFRVSVGLRDGRTIQPAQLSQGARDQLYVALRIAIADLVAGRVDLPMVFDDPFLTFDPDRMRRMRETFARMAEGGRQVWLLTHRPEFAAWGNPAEIVQLAAWPAWEAE